MYVKKIDWLDEVSKEAIVEVAEGIERLVCFSCPCLYKLNDMLREPLECLDTQDIVSCSTVGSDIKKLHEKQSYKIVLADKGLENWKHVEPNDFIISLRSFQGGLEISYIPGCITWHYIVLKPKVGVEPEYFKWLFKSPRYIQALQRTANFIRDGQDLRFSNFVQVPLPLIPMDEQKEIAEYLNKETARIDSIIADITEQIEKLKEYRQSVISEVVTGKVAVE
ncbi:MAG: restriction endonuclease subunit S [Butyricicoccus sp.]|jgi:restriction endonuclease S subunit|nr:restriction endonuclease subunit S [Butyricicoccus sp.]